jgi:hypothetical protein
MHRRALVLGMTLMVLLALNSRGWAAPRTQQIRFNITYPTDGMTISGVVEVTGSATHPDMHFYQLFYATGAQVVAETQWVEFAAVQGTQVENGVLGAWDTATVPDGKYVLALAVWGQNDPSNPFVVWVQNLTVNNAQPVPSPTSEQATPESMPTEVIGLTPTPISVEQPATATPRPPPTSLGEGEETATPQTGGEERPRVQFDTGRLRHAFCSGGLITLMLFLLGVLYQLAKVSIRWYLRQRPGPPWGE